MHLLGGSSFSQLFRFRRPVNHAGLGFRPVHNCRNIYSTHSLVDLYVDLVKLTPAIRRGNYLRASVCRPRDGLHLRDRVRSAAVLHRHRQESASGAAAQIPAESLRGFHICYKYRCPSLSDPIPWAGAFGYVRNIEQPILINPETHHANRVKDAVVFGKLMLG